MNLLLEKEIPPNTSPLVLTGQRLCLEALWGPPGRLEDKPLSIPGFSLLFSMFLFGPSS